MKTLQECINEVNRDELEGAFYVYYMKTKQKLDMLEKSKYSEKENRQTMHEQFERYYHRLTQMEIESSSEDSDCLFVTEKHYEAGISNVVASLYSMNELMSLGVHSKTSDYRYTKQAVVLGYKVFESELFMETECEVLAEILYEMAFFGFEQEYLETALEELECQSEVIYDNFSADELFADYDEQGNLLTTVRYPEENSFKQHMMETENKYNAYCRAVEVESAAKELHRASTRFDNFENAMPDGRLTAEPDGKSYDIIAAYEYCKMKHRPLTSDELEMFRI